MSNSNLFSDLLAKPSVSKSNVSSVNDNVDSINVNANFDKPGYLQSAQAFGDYWDSYEMGMTFEQAVERWEAANTPEQRERVLADLKERAIRRADLDVRNGRIRFAMTEGADDWHGLGVRFKDNPTGFEMLLAAGLDEEVQKVLAEYSGVLSVTTF